MSTSWSAVAAIAAAGRSAQLMAAEEVLRSRSMPGLSRRRSMPAERSPVGGEGANEFGGAADATAGAPAARNRAAKTVMATARQSVAQRLAARTAWWADRGSAYQSLRRGAFSLAAAAVVVSGDRRRQPRPDDSFGQARAADATLEAACGQCVTADVVLLRLDQ